MIIARHFKNLIQLIFLQIDIGILSFAELNKLCKSFICSHVLQRKILQFPLSTVKYKNDLIRIVMSPAVASNIFEFVCGHLCGIGKIFFLRGW